MNESIYDEELLSHRINPINDSDCPFNAEQKLVDYKTKIVET